MSFVTFVVKGSCFPISGDLIFRHIERVTAVTARLCVFQLDWLLGGPYEQCSIRRVVEQPRKLDLVPPKPASTVDAEAQWDPHPLLPVFVAMAVSLALSVTLIGTILAWLALRHSGVMAP